MFKTFLNKTSILLVKFIIRLLRAGKFGSGTNLPGRVARKLRPHLFSDLVLQNKGQIFTVSGTNGKTTTAGLLAGILREEGRKIIHNSRGANLLSGITTAVIEKADLNGKIESDNCIFEVDEAFLQHAFKEFTPNIVAVTNLFRDQLDRYGELNTTAAKIESAIKLISGNNTSSLILNADDPGVSFIGANSQIKKVFFGFEEISFKNNTKLQSSDNLIAMQVSEAGASKDYDKRFSGKAERLAVTAESNTLKAHSYNFSSQNMDALPQEITNCNCGKHFSYSKIFYGHLGWFYCLCGNKRPEPEVLARAEIDSNSSAIFIKSKKHSNFSITTNLPGVYNCYNVLCAITMALESGINPENIKKGIENYTTAFGRSEFIELNNKKVLIQLIKNPVGATESLKTVLNNPPERLLIIINDNYADGRDVSWLWDANFEILKDFAGNIVTSGIRAEDMAVRLKYAGVSSDKIEIISSIKSALKKSIELTEKNKTLYVFPTYTALLELEKIKLILE